MLRRLLPVIVLAAGVVVPTFAAAGGFHITIFGARRTGMLTNLGAPDDVTSVFHNPAAMADQEGLRLHLSGSSAFLDTDFRLKALDPERFPDIDPEQWGVDDQGYYDRRIEPISTFGVLPYVGGTYHLGPHGLDGVAVGAAVTAPNLYGATLPDDAPTSYFFVEGHFVTISPLVGIGWRINDWLSVGANAMWNYMQLAYAQEFAMADLLLPAQGEATFAEQFEAGAAQQLIGDVRLDYTGEDSGYGWTLSALLTPLDGVGIGLGWAESTDANFGGDVKIKPVRDDVSLDDMNALLAERDYKLPQRLNVEMAIPPSWFIGANFEIADWLEIGIDYRLWQYSVFDVQVMEPIYDADQPGREPITKEELSKDKEYGDSWELALGVLVRPWSARRELEVMAGYGFDKSPVPNKTFSIDNPSMNQHVLAGGLRWNATSGFRVSATWLHIEYADRDVRNSIGAPPLNLVGRGSSDLPRLEIEYLF